MSQQTQRLRGRATGLNLGYSVCIALVLAFLIMLAVVSSLFAAGADANNQSLDERAGISSSSRAASTAEAAETPASQNAETATSSKSKSATSEAAATEDSLSNAGMSKADNTAVAAGTTYNDGGVTGKYKKLGEKHVVTYSWKNAPGYSTFIYDKNGSPQFVFLPGSEEVRAGSEFTVDSDYSEGTTYYTMSDGKFTGKFVFSGWSVTGTETMPDEDLEITGTWKYEIIADKTEPSPAPTPDPDSGKGDKDDKGDKGDTPDKGDGDKGDKDDKDEGDQTAKHNVTYSWAAKDKADSDKNLPVLYDAYFVDEAGAVVEPEAPAAQQYAEGAEFLIDTTWYAGKKLYVVDLQGNKLSAWMFSGWSLFGPQVMGQGDVEITGSWSSALVLYRVSYDWTDAPAEGTVLHQVDQSTMEPMSESHTVKLPDAVEKTSGIDMTLDDEFEKDAEYAELDADGNVTGYWTFGGWESDEVDPYQDPSTGKYAYQIGQKDIVFKASWTYRSA